MEITLQLLVVTLVVAFGLTSLVTSMFEMMRTGFALTLHIIVQMLAFVTALIAWILVFLDPQLTLYSGITMYVVMGTAILAILALLTWVKNMFSGLMLFRCMQGASFHTQVFSHQLIFVILSLLAVLMVLP